MINPTHDFSVEFCVPWNYVPRAVGLTAEIVEGWAPVIRDFRLIPSKGGVFEVIVDGELVFSKKALKRHAAEGEIAALVEQRLGPKIPRD